MKLKDQRIPVMMAVDEVTRIDDWRRHQPALPSRSEAIRRLVELGLIASEARRRARPKTAAEIAARNTEIILSGTPYRSRRSTRSAKNED